ncbi:ABC transporter ATP-binding protein [Corynebacterium casei]|uniref:ABC transporter ATP-binding protein n=1 Tax=Corynebacterium casei TaxID=160386 RepID=UPI001D026D87|nr:ABC transporter ATP-binding protein [Corynebacterium casei]
MPSDKVVVVARNISKTYKVFGKNKSIFSAKRKPVEALKDVSFVAYSGECIGILGKNGSGKSTLLSIIAGNETATSGLVRVSTEPTLLGVSAALQPKLTGRENTKIGLLAMGLYKDEVEELIDPVIEWAELSDSADRPMETYSSGMKSRLKFAIATAVKREILMVDEALSTGDATFAEKARKRMQGFLDDAGTVFIVSHSAGTIQKHCTRVIWLYEGSVIADGAPKKILRSYKLWTKRLSAGNKAGAQHVINNTLRRYSKPQIYLESEYQNFRVTTGQDDHQTRKSRGKHRLS